jgi:hypothetical protein
MSTPNFGPDQSEAFEKFMSILKAANNLHMKAPEARAAKEAASVLPDLSVRFEAVKINTPIFSMYESLETKLKDGRFKSKNIHVSTIEIASKCNVTDVEEAC